MITPEVVEFIRTQDAKGVSRETTRITLVTQGGWSHENIDKAFAAIPLIFTPTGPDGTPSPLAYVEEVAEPEENGHPIIAGILVTILVLGISTGVIALFEMDVLSFFFQMISEMRQA